MSASQPEVRAARSYLRSKVKAGTGDIPPRHFANAAKETGMGFQDLTGVLARIYAGGQNESLYREMAVEQGAASGG